MDEFYFRLFEAAPEVRPLFPVDMRRQKTILLGALVLLRKSLRNLDAIVPTCATSERGTSPMARSPSTTRLSARS